MKKNMGSMDKGIRIFLAVIIAILYFTNQITGVAAIVLGHLCGGVFTNKLYWLLSALCTIQAFNFKEI